MCIGYYINGNPDKSRLRANGIAARNEWANHEFDYSIADRDLSPPAFSAPHCHIMIEWKARRWDPHGNSQESGLTPRTCFTIDADTRSLYAHPSRCITLRARPKCLTWLRKVGRGSSIAPETPRRLRLRRGTEWAGNLTWTCN
jgi:hypothetical protein